MFRRLAKDIAVYGAGDLLFKFVGFAVFPIYAHVFSVEDFGIMALGMVTAGLVSIIANLGLNNAVQRFYWDPLTKENDQPMIISTGLFVLCIWSIVLVGILVGVLYHTHGIIYARYKLAWMILALALLTVIPEQVLQYALDTIRLHFAPWKYTLVSFLKNFLGVALGLVLILAFEIGVVGVFWGGFVAALVGVPVALFLIRKDLAWRLDSSAARQLLGFGYPFIFAGAAYWIFGSMDRWMLAELSDNVQVGLYSIAFKLAGIMIFVNTAFGQAWSPMAIKILRDEPNYRELYGKLLTSWFYFLALVGSGIALFGYEALYVLTPAEYWPAASVVGAIAMGLVLSGTTQITMVGISLERKTKLLAVSAWATAIVNFLLNWLLIPYWGALGAAIATFLSYGLLTGMLLFWSQSLHPIPLEKSKLIFCVIVVGAMLVLSSYIGRFAWTINILALKFSALTAITLGAFWLRIVDSSGLVVLFQFRRWA